MRADKQILLATQQNPSEDEPTPGDHLQRRHARLGAAASEAARRHREGAGRGRRAAPRSSATPPTSPTTRRTRARCRTRSATQVEVEALARSVVAEFENYVKLNKKISPEVVGAVEPDRRLLQGRRHGRLAPRDQDPREAGDPRAADRGRAAGARARPDGERDLRPPGREAHPLARQAPDGEDPARVLSERADEGDPEGTRRLRGRPGRACGARGEDRARPSSRRKPARRRRTS